MLVYFFFIYFQLFSWYKSFRFLYLVTIFINPNKSNNGKKEKTRNNSFYIAKKIKSTYWYTYTAKNQRYI